MNRDRRRSRRMVPPVKTTVAVRAGDSGRLLDISAHGALIEVDHPMPPRKRCSLTIDGADNADDAMVLAAEVRRCRAVTSPLTGALAYHAAVVFRNTDPERIEDWIVDMSLAEGSGSAPAVRRVVKVAEPSR